MKSKQKIPVGKSKSFVGPVAAPHSCFKYSVKNCVLCILLFVITAMFFMACFHSEIFPYLVIVVGVENILVITKSVVSTPVDLEVKMRVAQGSLLVPVLTVNCTENKINTTINILTE